MGDPEKEFATSGDGRSGASEPDSGASSPHAPNASIAERLTGSAALVPEWLVNLAALGWRVLVIAGLALVAAYLASLLWTITASILLSIVVAASFAPLVIRLRANGRSRGAAAGITWVVAIAVVLGILILLVVALLPVAADLLSRIQAGLAELQAWLDENKVHAFVGDIVRDAIGAIQSVTGDTSGGIVASIAEIGTILVLATFLLFYFLRDGDKGWLWIFQSVSETKRDQITQAGDEALARIGGYLRGTTILAGLIAISDFVFMAVLGVPFALPLAVMVLFAGYIPYFGGVVATGIVLLVALSELGMGTVLLLAALFVIRDIVLRYTVRPSVYAQTVYIQPGLAIVVILAGYELAGVIGLIAAVPLTAVVLAVASAVIAIVEPATAPELPGLVPAWLDRAAQFSWRILVGVGFVALLILILTTMPLVLIPIIVALIMAATLDPLTNALAGRGLSRTMAAATAVFGTFIVIAAVLVLAIVTLVDQAEELGGTIMDGVGSTDEAADGHLGLATEAASTGSDSLVRAVVEFGQTFGAAILIVVVSALLSYYFLRDGGRVWSGALSYVRPAVRSDTEAAGSRAFSVLGGYMTGTAAISFVGAASQFVIMVVLGLPLALPVFVLSFFLGFIPYIGGFISTGIAFLIAVAVGSTSDIVIMFIWTIVFNLVTGSIVAPVVYGKTVHIHPAIVLVAIPAGSTIAGILGMFIVVPALGVVAVTWRTVLEVMGAPKGADPPEPIPTPPAASPAEPADSS